MSVHQYSTAEKPVSDEKYQKDQIDQIADSVELGKQPSDDKKMQNDRKKYPEPHSKSKNDQHFESDISRVPLVTTSIKNHQQQHVKKPVSYNSIERSSQVKYENDNAEGGGDKEFHTAYDDIYLNDLGNNVNRQQQQQKHKQQKKLNNYRYRRSYPVLPLLNQYSNRTDVSTQQDEKQQISQFANIEKEKPTASSSSSLSLTSLPAASLLPLLPLSSSLPSSSISSSSSAPVVQPPVSSPPSVSSHGANDKPNTNSALKIPYKQLQTAKVSSDHTTNTSDNSSLTDTNRNNDDDSDIIGGAGDAGDGNDFDFSNAKNTNSNEQIIIISEGEDDVVGDVTVNLNSDSRSDSDNDDLMMGDEPRVLPLRPIIRGPYEDGDDDHQGEVSVVYAEPHTEVKLNCDVDLDIMRTVWMKDGQVS